MTEREEIIDQIISVETRKLNLARRALAHETSGEYGLADQCDAWWNAASDEIGQLRARLYEIEAAASRREFLEDHPVGGRML